MLLILRFLSRSCSVCSVCLSVRSALGAIGAGLVITVAIPVVIASAADGILPQSQRVFRDPGNSFRFSAVAARGVHVLRVDPMSEEYSFPVHVGVSVPVSADMPPIYRGLDVRPLPWWGFMTDSSDGLGTPRNVYRREVQFGYPWPVVGYVETFGSDRKAQASGCYDIGNMRIFTKLNYRGLVATWVSSAILCTTIGCLARYLKVRNRRKRGLCPTCRYPTGGLATGQCPECGRRLSDCS